MGIHARAAGALAVAKADALGGPSRVRISAKMKAISVSGFCRPVSTLASLTGVASGRKVSDTLTHTMRSPTSAAVRPSVTLA
jgi:hypothetical protein